MGRYQFQSPSSALSLVGERWTMLILRETLFGVRRYGQFARNLGIPRPTLSLRLRKLVDAGLLERARYSTDPDRYEYRITPAGRDLFPAVIALMRSSDRHFAGPDGPPIALRHETCGQPTHPHVTCDLCGEEIDNRNVTPETRPGLPHGGSSPLSGAGRVTPPVRKRKTPLHRAHRASCASRRGNGRVR